VNLLVDIYKFDFKGSLIIIFVF